MNKAEKLRNKKKEWMESLQKQISDKKDKASMLKNKDIIWSQVLVCFGINYIFKEIC